MTSALAFLALCELLGLAALPLVAATFAWSPAAVGLAKPLGLLLGGWVAWLLGATGLGMGIGILVAGLLAVAMTGALVTRGAGGRPLPVSALGARRARFEDDGSAGQAPGGRSGLAALLGSRAFWVPECVFLLSFAVMAAVVSHAPDVWGTEKPMDMALVNALAVGDDLPPANPWLAGTELDGYYYLGHWLAALLVVGTGSEPTVGYNLALAAFFALAASAAYAVGAGLATVAGRRPVLAGTALVGVVLVAGNLAAALKLLRHEGPLSRYPWFETSRVIPDTINEFPAFSWLLGDLHAHLLAVPITLVALALALHWLNRGPGPLDVIVAAIISGSLYAINAWSYPVISGLLVLALAASPGRLVGRASYTGVLLAGGLIAILPFLLAFQAPASGLALVTERRPLLDSARDGVLTVGLGIWLLAPAYLALARSRPPRTVAAVAASTAVAVAAGVLSGARLGWVALLLAAAGVAAWQLLRPGRSALEAFVWLTAFGGVACLLLPEVVFVRDAFAGTALERMNTVFKLGYQAWLLLGAAGVAAVLAHRRALAPPVRLVWTAGAALIAVGAAAFPVAGTYARTDGFSGPMRLRGLDWLASGAPGDVAAIAWLRRHAAPDAVVLESAGADYSPSGHARISTFTGRPTVLGWPGHVLQWGEDPGQRAAAVARLYREPSAPVARPLLESLEVDYVVVGPLERSDHGTTGEAKWDELGERVFDEDGTRIWRLR